MITKGINTQYLNDSICWITEDFIQITRTNFKTPKINESDILVFSSKNAVKSFLTQHKMDILKNHTVVCVGHKTANLLKKENLIIKHVSNTSDQLGMWIVNNCNHTKIIHFCGNVKREELKNIVTPNNFKYQAVEVYQTTLTPQKINQKIDGVLFLSPSAIKSFIISNSTDKKVAFCIGDTTANEAKKYFSKVITSQINTIESTIDTINKYYRNV